MRKPVNSVAGVVALVICLASVTGAFAQTQGGKRMVGGAAERPERSGGAPVKGAYTPNDPAIPAPSDLVATTSSRAFVESFFVALSGTDPQVAYHTYLHDRLKQQVSADAFARQMGSITGVVGDLELVVIQHLREKNPYADMPGHGDATYILVFAQDERVDAQVEFERGQDGLWKVTAYRRDSPLLDRLYRDGVEDGEDPQTGENGEVSPP